MTLVGVAAVYAVRFSSPANAAEQAGILLLAHGNHAMGTGGHGDAAGTDPPRPPNDEEDNKLWLANMERTRPNLKAKGFRAAEVLTHRNDVIPEIKDAAREAFRARVEVASRYGITVVVPLLLLQGRIERS